MDSVARVCYTVFIPTQQKTRRAACLGWETVFGLTPSFLEGTDFRPSPPPMFRCTNPSTQERMCQIVTVLNLSTKVMLFGLPISVGIVLRTDGKGYWTSILTLEPEERTKNTQSSKS